MRSELRNGRVDRLAELRLQAGLVRDELQSIAADRIRRGGGNRGRKKARELSGTGRKTHHHWNGP